MGRSGAEAGEEVGEEVGRGLNAQHLAPARATLTMVSTPLVCSSCDAAINADEIVAGLAVRIDGQLLCTACVETLPPETQVGINRVRALRGLNVTTYRVPFARMPDSALFTFTTSSQLNVHRRQLVTTGSFVAPLLPPPSQRPGVPGATENAPPSAPARPNARPNLLSASGRRLLLIGLGVGAGVLMLGAAAIAIAASGEDERAAEAAPTALTVPAVERATAPTARANPAPTTAPPVATTVVTVPVAPRPPRARSEAQDDPLAAWRDAQADPDCPPAVLAALAESVMTMRGAQLDAAERALQAGRSDEARLRLRAMRLPADTVFAALTRREAELGERLASPPVAAPAPLDETPIGTAVTTPVVPPGPVEAAPPPPPPATAQPVDADHPRDLFATGTVSEWLPAFAFPQRAVEDAKDGSVLIPSPWPLGTAFFYRAVKPTTGTRRYALALEIPVAKVAGGGLAVLVHRGSATRATLAVSLLADAATTPLEPLRLDKGWQQLAIAMPRVTSTAPTVVLRLEDGDDKSADRGFVLGKVVLVAGRAPTPKDLALGPAPQLGDDPLLEAEARTRLRTLLAKVQQRRPAKAKAISINRIALAIADLDDETFDTFRKPFLTLIGRELERSEVVKLALTSTAWDDLQFGPVADINADAISVVALCPNVREVAALADPDAFAAWMQRQLNAMIVGDAKGKRGGILPVAVIGALVPSRDAADLARLGLLWDTALGECARLGIPVIDIRAAQTAPPDEHRAKAARLLVEGLRTLGLQLNATQRGSR